MGGLPRLRARRGGQARPAPGQASRSDTRSATAYTYAFNKRNRIATATVGGVLKGTYTYNGLEQLAIRVTTNMTPSGTTHFIHDLAGNVIAETAGGGPTGATGPSFACSPPASRASTSGCRSALRSSEAQPRA